MATTTTTEAKTTIICTNNKQKEEEYNNKVNNIINNCTIQKIIVGFCWKDKYSCRRWKISLSQVSWRFHYFLSMFCSEHLDLTRSEESMTLDKDINIFNHFKYSKFSLFQFPPKKIQITTMDFKRLIENITTTTATTPTNVAAINYCQQQQEPQQQQIEKLEKLKKQQKEQISLLFSNLESIDLEYNGYSMNSNDLLLLFSSVETIKNVSVQFNGHCCLYALGELNKFLNNLNLKSFSLLFLEEDGGRAEKMQIRLPDIEKTTTTIVSPSQQLELQLQKQCSSISAAQQSSTHYIPTCIRSYISSKNVYNLESLHLESVSIFMLQELVCSLHHGRLDNLKNLVIIFDDSNLFSRISSEAFFTGLGKLPKLKSLFLSISIVFNGITDDQELFDLSSFQKYLQYENTLETLSIDFMSDSMPRVFTKEFIQFLLSEKSNLKKLRINTPLLSNIGNKSSITSLTLDYQVNLKCCQLNEIDKLIQNLTGNGCDGTTTTPTTRALSTTPTTPKNSLKKLVLFNNNQFVNTFISRLLIHDRNGSIENLKVSIGKQEFCQILNALSLNTTLKTLTLSTTNEITQDHIQSLLLTIQDHPQLYKIVIETTCTSLCPYFLKNNFSIYYNYIKLKYYIFKK